eukprot:910950-Pleurochrysis_carterae.AAC.4
MHTHTHTHLHTHTHTHSRTHTHTAARAPIPVQAANGLHRVRCATALGLVFVNLNAEAPPLAEWLGDLLPAIHEYSPTLESADLVSVGYSKTYNPHVNWKILIENYLECVLALTKPFSLYLPKRRWEAVSKFS